LATTVPRPVVTSASERTTPAAWATPSPTTYSHETPARGSPPPGKSANPTKLAAPKANATARASACGCEAERRMEEETRPTSGERTRARSWTTPVRIDERT